MSYFSQPKNSFGEDVTGLPSTDFTSLAYDDFDTSNTFKVAAKFKTQHGSVKINNAVRTLQQEGEGAPSYSVASDYAIETKMTPPTAFQAKIKGSGVQS